MNSAAQRALIIGGGAFAVAAGAAVIVLAITDMLSLVEAGVLLALTGLVVLVAALSLVAWRTLLAVRHAEREITAALERHRTPAEPIVEAVRAEAANLSSAVTELAMQHGKATSTLHERVDAMSNELADHLGKQAEARTKRDQAMRARLDRVLEEERQLYWQLEALLELRAQLPPRAPMPPLRGWAASPDVLHWMLTWAHYHQPRRIVECGSGVSTVLFGYHVKRTGVGAVIALEHDKRFAAQTRELTGRHGVDDVVEVREAPLSEWQHGDRTWQWYDLAAVEDIAEIDLLFVDGPPQATGEMARFPSGPVLLDRLAPDGVAVLDDATRPDESRASDLWLEQLPGLERQRLNTDKGTDVFRRSFR